MGINTSSSRVDWNNGYDDRPAIRSLRHMSFRCFDAEETRAFFEDFLGLELAAALPFETEVDGKTVDGIQILFRMSDGDFIGFYDIPDAINADAPDIFMHLDPMELHLGMKVSSEAEMLKWAERCKERGLDYLGPMDHEMVWSIYFRDPNGLWIEITYEVDAHEEIMTGAMSGAKDLLATWTIESSPKKKKFREIQSWPTQN